MFTEKELQVLLLRKQGLLQRQIAKKLGITQAAVSRFEAVAKAKIGDAQADLALLKRLGLLTHDAPLEQKLRRLR